MPDFTDLDVLSGEELGEDRIRGILKQIDLDVVNLLRDGKLAAARYGIAGRSTDRATNLKALLTARQYYEDLLKTLPSWETSRYDDDTEAAR